LPVAHGEGRFMAPESTIDGLWSRDLVVFQYADRQGNPTNEYPANPNGSLQAVAAICDPTGRILGLMPHPERYHMPGNHPLHSLQEILARPYVDRSDPAVQERLRIAGPLPEEGAGLQIFRNAVEYCRENL